MRGNKMCLILFDYISEIFCQNTSVNTESYDTEKSPVPSRKFFGVHIGYHLTWYDHIRFIAAKIANNNGVLRRITYMLPHSIRLTFLYYSLVYP